MAAGQYLSLPAAATGLNLASGATAWAYGSWVEATASATEGMLITGLEFAIQASPAVADATYEQLFEIGTGAGGSEVVKLQVPFSYHTETLTSTNNGLGYWMTKTFVLYFPEPVKVNLGTRVAVRVTDSIASAVPYDGVKILYKVSEAPTVVLNTPTNTATISDKTPTLNITGTDAEGDNVEYKIQIDKAITFDSGRPVESLDQHQDSASTGFGFGEAAGIISRGQKFTPSVTGTLSKLGFNRNKGSYGLRVYIDTITSGVPTNNRAGALYTFDISNANVINGYGEYILPSPPTLTAGTEYCFYLEPWDVGGSNTYHDDYQNCNGVNSGSGSREITDNGSWFTENLDFNYATYMTVTTAGPLLEKASDVDSGFTAGHPFASGVAKDFTVQDGDALADGTYYWRAASKDPTGSGTYGGWSAPYSFTLLTSATVTVTPLTAAFDQQSPTITANQSVTVSPSDGAAAFDVPAPTITAKQNITATPSEGTSTFSQQSPTIKLTTTSPATTLDDTATIQSPTISATQNTVAAATALDVLLATIAPSVIVRVGVTANASALDVNGAIQAPAVSGEAIATIANVPITLTLEAPSITTIQNVTTTPAQADTTVTGQTPAVSTVANVTSTPTPGNISGDAEPVSTIEGATITPPATDAAVTVEATTVMTNINVTVAAGAAELNLSVEPVVATAQKNVTVGIDELLTALQIAGATITGSSVASVNEGAVAAAIEDPRIEVIDSYISTTVNATVLQLVTALQSSSTTAWRRRGLYTYRVPYDRSAGRNQNAGGLLYKNKTSRLYN